MKLHRITTVALAMAALVVGITMRGHLLIFVDPISIGLATLAPMLMMVVTYGRRSADLARAVGAWLMGRDSGATDPAAHRTVAGMARDYGQYAVVNGCICALIGHVMMLQNMSDPNAIGPALAVSLLTIFYGFIIQLVVAVPVSHHHLALAGASPHEFAHQGPSLRALGLVGFNAGMSFLMMLAALDPWD